MANNQATLAIAHFRQALENLTKAHRAAKPKSEEQMQLLGMTSMLSGLISLASAINDLDKKLETMAKGR